MKKHYILPSVFLVLLLILISTAVLLPAGAETIVGSVKYDPDRINLNLPAPSIVNAIIRFPSGKGATVKDIDPSTILLEGSLPPTSTSTFLIPGALVAEFDGEMVVNIIWGKIYHMGGLPPSDKVWLTVTGNLYESVGGTPFSATGYIKVTVPNSPPPP